MLFPGTMAGIQIGEFVQVPSWKVTVTVGPAACPVPADVTRALKAASVPRTEPMLAVVPQPAEIAKSPATIVVPRLALRRLKGIVPLNVEPPVMSVLLSVEAVMPPDGIENRVPP